MAAFEYFRIYADDAGESHFEDVRIPMSSVDFAPPAAPLDFASVGDASSMSVISSDAGWQGQTFHPAPARQFMVLVEGSGRITTSDGKTRTCSTGTRFLLEDTTGRGHSSEFFEKTTVLVIRMPA